MHYPTKGKAPKPKIKTGGSTVRLGKLKPNKRGAKGGKG